MAIIAKDYHAQIDFETASEDAELLLEIFDKDKVGDDDFISQVGPMLATSSAHVHGTKYQRWYCITKLMVKF